MNDNMKVFADGEAYERLMGRWSRLIGDLFLDWLALPNGLRCLDVGCGNGAFTEVLIAHGVAASVVGLDPSDGQIDFARERPGAKSAEFRIGDAQAMPFGDKSFDAALMALVISLVPDPNSSRRRNGAGGAAWRLGSHLYVGHRQWRAAGRAALPRR